MKGMCCSIGKVVGCMVLALMLNGMASAQVNYSLNCAGSFTCNQEDNGSVSVSITETQRLMHVTSITNFDFVYAPALFGADVYITALSGDIQYFANPDNGCAAYPAGTFSGKVALIDRGVCSFESKAWNAQNAGAVGVIIVNNVAGAPFLMGGNNLLGVNIPAIMISQSDGLILKNLLAQPAVVNAKTPQYTYQWSCGATTPQVTGLKEGSYVVTVLSNDIDTLSCTTQILANSNVVNIVTNSSLINCPFEPVDLSASSFNNALLMNGTNQWVNLNANVTNLNDASFTIEAWINTSSGSEGIVVSNNSNSVWEAGERAFYIDDIGRPTFSGFDNGSMTSSMEVDDGNWHHVAVVWDYTVPPGIGKIYIDGFDRTVSMNYTSSASGNIGSFKIGRPNFSITEAPNYFDGLIDDVRIWNIPLSGLDIRTGMVNSVLPSTPGLLTYFKFSEASGSSVVNASNNLSNGSFVNAPLRMDALTYLWTPTGDSTSAITVTTPGIYSLSVTDYLGCVAQSASVAINTVHVTPSGSVTICNGDSVLLDAGINTNPIYGFSEIFDTNNWSTVHSANDSGNVNVNAAPNSIRITSSNTHAVGSPSSTIDFCNVMNGDGNVEFNWDFSSVDGPQSDYPEIGINGTWSSFSNLVYGVGAPIVQNGVESFSVLKGQNFCFRMNSSDNQGNAASIIISNVRFPDSYAAYLWNTGATTQSIQAATAGNYMVSVTASNACSVSSSPVTLSVNTDPKLTWYVDNDGDGFGNESVDSLYCFQPLGYVSNGRDCNDTLNYIHPNVLENCFNGIDDNCNNIIDEGCGVGGFQLKVMLEGYQVGGGFMTPTLFNNGIHPDPNASDSIVVELRSATSPYPIIQTDQVVLYRNGFANVSTYPSSGTYFIVIKSRNGIEIWSKTPVLFDGKTEFYDFSK